MRTKRRDRLIWVYREEEIVFRFNHGGEYCLNNRIPWINQRVIPGMIVEFECKLKYRTTAESQYTMPETEALIGRGGWYSFIWPQSEKATDRLSCFNISQCKTGRFCRHEIVDKQSVER